MRELQTAGGRRSSNGVGRDLCRGVCDLADMRRTCAAAAADDLGTGGEPFRGERSIGFRVVVPGPAAALGVPILAGVGIDNDGFGSSRRQFADEGDDERGVRAVDADGNGLREVCDGRGTVAEQLAVSYVLFILAGEGEPGGEVWVRREGFADGMCFFEGWERFEGESFPASDSRKDFDPRGVKGD